MDSKEKIIVLNKAAEDLKNSLENVLKCFPENQDIIYYVWKLKKLIGKMHVALYDVLQKEITEEDFKKIIKNIQEG